jgi:PleD family two-component response regulator
LDIEFKTIMNLADKALYKAKQTGKNKIVFDTL